MKPEEALKKPPKAIPMIIGIMFGLFITNMATVGFCLYLFDEIQDLKYDNRVDDGRFMAQNLAIGDLGGWNKSSERYGNYTDIKIHEAPIKLEYRFR